MNYLIQGTYLCTLRVQHMDMRQLVKSPTIKIYVSGYSVDDVCQTLRKVGVFRFLNEDRQIDCVLTSIISVSKRKHSSVSLVE